MMVGDARMLLPCSTGRRRYSVMAVTRKKTSIDRAPSRKAPKRKAVAEPSIAIDETRRVLGRESDRWRGAVPCAALFPAPQPISELPRGYAETLRQLKARIHHYQIDRPFPAFCLLAKPTPTAPSVLPARALFAEQRLRFR